MFQFMIFVFFLSEKFVLTKKSQKKRLICFLFMVVFMICVCVCVCVCVFFFFLIYFYFFIMSEKY